MNGDLISRAAAIDALWKALYTYEDETERRFQESDELNVGDWIGHRIFVQNMNDIDRQTILNLPSAQPEVKEIGYAECANAMLKMWIDNVLTDGEYNRIMDKLNAHHNAGRRQAESEEV